MVYKRKDELTSMNLLIDIDNQNESQDYVKLNIVRNLNSLKGFHHNHSCIMHNVGMNVSNYIDRLIEFESTLERKFTNESNYEARYGILLDVLLPKGDWSDSTKKKLAAKYVRYIIGEEKQLKYIAWDVKKSKRTWMKIYISDREFYPQTKAVTYKRDLYVRKDTKGFCKANAEGAIKVASKGEVKKDSDGNVIFESIVFKKKKSRRFCYKDAHKEAFLKSFKEFFIQALVKCKCKLVKGKFFVRMNLRYAINPEQRRIIIAVNRCMQYIQNQLNIEYQKSLVYLDAYDITAGGGSRNERVPGDYTKKWLTLFEKYRLIFRKKVHVVEEETISLSGRCDKVEDATIRLKEIFDKELKNIKSELVIAE